MGAIFGLALHDEPLPGAPVLARALAPLEEYGPPPVHDSPAPDVLLAASGHPWQEDSRAALVRGRDGAILAGDLLLTGGGLAGSAPPDDPTGDLAHVAGAALRHAGGALFDRLFGEFALAVYAPGSRTLALGRDVLGTRPLYWSAQGRRFAFASDVRCLLALPWVERRVDLDRLAFFFAHPGHADHDPILAGLESVPPGHWLEWEAGRVQVRRYWYPKSVAEVRHPRLEDHVEEVRAVVGRAVADRLREPGRIGAHFSGGLDSTTLAVLARRDRELTGLYTWSPATGPEHPAMEPKDERPVLQRLARELGAPLRYGASDDEWPRVVEEDAALLGMSLHSEEERVLKQAHGDGCRVLLSGWCGDELISLNQRGWFGWLLSRGRFLAAARVARRRWRRRGTQALGPWAALVLPLLPDPLYRRLGGRPFVPFEDRLWSPELRERYEHATPDRVPAWRAYGTPRANQLALVASGHMSARMNGWARRAAGRRLVHRYPLADRRVVELALGTPAPVLNADHRSRGLFRRAFLPLLPPGINKQDPANERKRAGSRARSLGSVARALGSGELAGACPWLDGAELRALLRAHDRTAWSDQDILAATIRLFDALRVFGLWRREVRSPIPT